MVDDIDLLLRVEQLEKAILEVVTQDLDNICWMDVYTKLAGLVNHNFDPLLLPKQSFDNNCKRFSLAMYSNTSYKEDKLTSYVKLLELIAKEHHEAKSLLQHHGYGVTGTPLIERIKEILRNT